jgi:hypothetical protein
MTNPSKMHALCWVDGGVRWFPDRGSAASPAADDVVTADAGVATRAASAVTPIALPITIRRVAGTTVDQEEEHDMAAS